MHMTQPFPYFVQLDGGPAVPVASMKTSPSKRTFSPPCFAMTAFILTPSISTSSTRVESWMLISFFHQKSLNHRLHRRHIIEGSMMMLWKLNVPVEAILVNKLEDFAAAHGDHLLGGREATIVSHDAAHQSGSQKHVRPFDQDDLCLPVFGQREQRHNRTILPRQRSLSC